MIDDRRIDATATTQTWLSLSTVPVCLDSRFAADVPPMCSTERMGWLRRIFQRSAPSASLPGSLLGEVVGRVEQLKLTDSGSTKPSVRNTVALQPSTTLRDTGLARSKNEHLELIKAFQEQFPAVHRGPPEWSNTWSESLLRRWYQADGNLTLEGLFSDHETHDRRLIDEVGSNYPTVKMSMVDLGAGGLLRAIIDNDTASIQSVLSSLEKNDYVATRLGASEASIQNVIRESEVAYPFMRPGETQNHLGVVESGLSPSGAKRGDRFVLGRRLPGDFVTDWGGIAVVDEAMGMVGATLRALDATNTLSCLEKRSDIFLARFPGQAGDKSPGYGAHLDGDEKTLLTAIFYTSIDWKEGDGGEISVLDEANKCWVSMAPKADSLLLFRSDRILHKVLPSFHSRVALTVFMSVGRTEADAQREQAALVGLIGAYA